FGGILSHPALLSLLSSLLPTPLSPPLFPYTTLFRSRRIRFYRSRCRPGASPAYRPLQRNRRGHRLRQQVSAMQQPARHQAHAGRSEEHTSELQSRFDLVCRLLLEKKNHPVVETTAPS